MSNSLALLSQSVAGLGTFSHTITAEEAGFVTVDVKSTIPQASALEINIKLNSTSKVDVGGAATNPTPTQQSIAAVARLQCAAADVINVVLSSANAVDSVPNAVKSVITLFRGE